MSSDKEILTFDDLQPYLLLKNGNYLYRVPFRNGWAVLKVYYGSRGFLERVAKSFDNVVLSGQTSYMPKTRLRVERECLDVWRHHGFRVFDTYDDVEVRAPNCPPGGYMLFEYCTGPKLVEYLSEPSLSLEDRWGVYHTFLQEWGRRHRIAVRDNEPRLVHENGDGKHVMILEEGFLWFDFEMIFRDSSRVREHVAHEIIQYLWFLIKNVPQEIKEELLEETIKGYPDRDLLYSTYEYFFNHPNRLHRMGRALDRRFYKRAQQPDSKYNVTRLLKACMDKI